MIEEMTHILSYIIAFTNQILSKNTEQLPYNSTTRLKQKQQGTMTKTGTKSGPRHQTVQKNPNTNSRQICPHEHTRKEPLYPKNTPLVQGNGQITVTRAIGPTLARPSRKTNRGNIRQSCRSGKTSGPAPVSTKRNQKSKK
jgi:hypothetical protein